MKRNFFLTFLLFVGTAGCLQAYGQASNWIVAGSLVDSASKKPIEFATITLKAPGDSVIVTGGLSDADGKFSIPVEAAGSYELRYYFVGYKTKQTLILLEAGQPYYNAGTVSLSQDGEMLDVVEVQGEKSYFQGSIDKKVYNIEKDIIASNGTASDALQTIPSVVIDIDGNISLRGNEGVRIFIDGKPSGIAGANMNAILEQIPASMIESIEVVTNPSARYDAEGNSGIINIVLKKNKKIGFNGNVSAGISTTPRYDGGASLNFRNEKLNFYSSYAFSHDERDSYGDVYRKTFDADTISYLNSEMEGTSISMNNMARAGLDWFIDEKTTLGISGSFNTSIGERDDLNVYAFLNEDSLLSSYSDRSTIGTNSGHGYNVGMNFRRTFLNPKQVLTAEGFYAVGYMEDDNTYDERFFDPTGLSLSDPVLQTIFRPNDNLDISAQSDYVHPFKNGNQFETGIKYTKEQKDNTFYSESFDFETDSWEIDDSLNNQFIYNEDVIAAYLIWNGTIKEKFGYQLGLRAEQTYTLSELITTDEDFVNNYFGLFPSVHVRYAFDPSLEIAASYSRRIDRPNSWFLNPFPDYSDPYTFRIGNPFLNPEYENSYEISLEKDFKKHSISGSIYLSQTLNEISPYTEVSDEGISYMTFQNYNSESQYGVELVTRDEWFKWWNMTTTFNFNQNLVNAENLEDGLTNQQFTYTARIMQMFALYKQTSLQLTMNYNTPWTFAQGKSDPVFFMDAGIKSDFFQNKLSVNVNISDIFDTRQWGGYSEGINFYQEHMRKRQSQIAMLKVTYKFGQQDNTRRRTRGMDDSYDGGIEMF